MRKKNVLPGDKGTVVKAVDHGGDTARLWYVHWRHGGKTLKKYGKLAHIPDVAARRVALEELRLCWQRRVDASQVETVVAMLRAHLLDLKERRAWRWKSYQTNASRVEVLAAWLKGRRPTPALLSQFLAGRRAVSHPVTYNKYVTCLKSYFDGIGQSHLWPGDVQLLPKAKRKSKPAKWLQKHEMNMLATAIAARDPMLWMAVRMMYNLALRPGELRMLRAKHFLLDAEVVHVPAEVSKVGVERFPRIPKAFLPDLDFLRAWQPERLLFPAALDAGKPQGKNVFTIKIRRVMDELGFGAEYRPCYSFRHTSAMQGIRDGVDVREMQQQFGHHSLDQFIQYVRQLGFNDLDDFAMKFRGI